MEYEQSKGLPRDLYLISFASFLFQLSIYTVQPILTLYFLELGATLLQVGTILAFQAILRTILRIPLTLAADRLGVNKTVMLCFLVQITVPLLYSIASSPTSLYLIILYQILATGSFNQITMSIVSNMVSIDRQGEALGRYMTFFSLSMLLGPFITSILVLQIGYRELFAVSALFPLLGLLLLLRNRRVLKAGDDSALKPKLNHHRLNTLKLIKSFLRDRNISVLSTIRLVYSMSNTMFNTLFAIYATQELNFSPSLIAIMFSVIGLSNTLIKMPMGNIIDRFSNRIILFLTFIVIVLDYAAMAFAINLVSIVLVLIIFGASWGIRAVTEWAFLVRTASPEAKTITISYLSTFWDIGAALGSFLAGSIAESLPFSTIFLISAFINIPAVLLTHAMETSNKRAQNG